MTQLLDIAGVISAYEAGVLTPESVFDAVFEGIAARGERPIWISLGIGAVTLDDGRTVKCFLGEAYAVADAEDITVFGGWRNWLIARSSFSKI